MVRVFIIGWRRPICEREQWYFYWYAVTTYVVPGMAFVRVLAQASQGALEVNKRREGPLSVR